MIATGRWLSQERKRLNLGLSETARVVQRHHGTVYGIERFDRVVPPGWFPALRALGFHVPEGPALGAYSLTGLQLRTECRRVNASPGWVARELGIEESALRPVLDTAEIVPASWLFRLGDLGFQVPEVFAEILVLLRDRGKTSAEIETALAQLLARYGLDGQTPAQEVAEPAGQPREAEEEAVPASVKEASGPIGLQVRWTLGQGATLEVSEAVFALLGTKLQRVFQGLDAQAAEAKRIRLDAEVPPLVRKLQELAALEAEAARHAERSPHRTELRARAARLRAEVEEALHSQDEQALDRILSERVHSALVDELVALELKRRQTDDPGEQKALWVEHINKRAALLRLMAERRQTTILGLAGVRPR